MTTPNAEGYVYLMETLAASGYVTVSVSANALNCRDDFIPERTQLLLEHLRRWQREERESDSEVLEMSAGVWWGANRWCWTRVLLHLLSL